MNRVVEYQGGIAVTMVTHHGVKPVVSSNVLTWQP